MPAFGEVELEALYERLEKPVYNVVYRWVWNPEEARDIVQKTFVRLWRMRQRVEMATVEPLVYKIALNLARSRLRRRRIIRWVGLDAVSSTLRDPQDVEAGMARSQDRARVREAVLALPDELRQVIVLCELSDMKYEQIAEALSIPPGTVGSRRNRALRKLRELLE
jgi:RNA polymerase sigma-70 factor (ECF subfamily)